MPSNCEDMANQGTLASWHLAPWRSRCSECHEITVTLEMDKPYYLDASTTKVNYGLIDPGSKKPFKFLHLVHLGTEVPRGLSYQARIGTKGPWEGHAPRVQGIDKPGYLGFDSSHAPRSPYRKVSWVPWSQLIKVR